MISFSTVEGLNCGKIIMTVQDSKCNREKCTSQMSVCLNLIGVVETK